MPGSCPPLPDRRLAVIALAALVLRAAYIVVVRPDPLQMIDSSEYDALARALLAGQGLVDLVGYVRPPLYPLFVAGAYLAGGLIALQVAQLVIAALTVLAIGALGRTLSGSPRAGWAAAAFAAIYPWSFPWVGGIASETLFTSLLILALVAVARAAPDGRSRAAAIIGGALMGAASLARANALVLAPFLALWLFWRDRSVMRAVMFTVALGATLLPFAAYEAAQGNGLVIASSGGGLIFYEGNNPDVARLYSPDIRDDEWRQLNRASTFGPAALAQAGCPGARTVHECYEVTHPRDQQAFWYDAAFRYIAAHPGEWALTELRKLMHYWRPWSDPRAYSLPTVVASGLSFGALVLLALAGLRRLGPAERLLVVLMCVASTLSAVVWMVQLRYRTAMLDPILMAAAGPGAVWLFDRARRIRVRAAPAPAGPAVRTGPS